MHEHDIFVIAASRGGVQALQQLVALLPANLPATLFVVLHIGRSHSVLEAILRASGTIPVSQAKHGERIRLSHVFVAPPDHHMTVHEGIIYLDKGPKEHYTRPAADPLFRSAAAAYGPRVVGIVLTGGDGDGSGGLAAIKAAGGVCIVQDPKEAEDPAMPVSGLKADSPDYCLPLAEIPRLIVELSSSVDKRIVQAN